jgi:hypothetical protein
VVSTTTNTVKSGVEVMSGIRTEVREVAPFDDTLPELRALSHQTRTLVLEYLLTGDKEVAEAAAGYGSGAAAASAWRSKGAQAAIKALTRAEIHGEAVVLAIRTMKELMVERPGRSDAVRFSAAKWVLESAGHGAKADNDGLGDKPLAEMTESELARFIESQRSVIERDGHAGLISVTPDK